MDNDIIDRYSPKSYNYLNFYLEDYIVTFDNIAKSCSIFQLHHFKIHKVIQQQP